MYSNIQITAGVPWPSMLKNTKLLPLLHLSWLLFVQPHGNLVLGALSFSNEHCFSQGIRLIITPTPWVSTFSGAPQMMQGGEHTAPSWARGAGRNSMEVHGNTEWRACRTNCMCHHCSSFTTSYLQKSLAFR